MRLTKRNNGRTRRELMEEEDQKKEERDDEAGGANREHRCEHRGHEERTEKGGIIQWLKRLKSSRGLELLRLPGAPEEGQTFTGKEKRGRGGKNQQPAGELQGPRPQAEHSESGDERLNQHRTGNKKKLFQAFVPMCESRILTASLSPLLTIRSPPCGVFVRKS
ncbi:unnamed protein product [Pleuronectes platessa]|uniref:Uncharacterized protein n=1 Tax=Pleuronectes platessa TaxID=8262 RepID=A0A9N7Z891_PLEPL|nr:unnamed protein product [Pleuronectes platessa]